MNSNRKEIFSKMKKNSAIIAIIIVVFSSLSGCGRKIENTAAFSKNPETEIMFETETESIVREEAATEQALFDYDGNINYTIKAPVYDLVEYDYNNGGLRYSYSDFIIDSSGRVMEKTVSGDKRGRYSYEYDEEGRMIAENYISPGYEGLTSDRYENSIFTYNEEGQIATEAVSTSRGEGEIFYEHTYKYDEQGRVIEEAVTNTSKSNYTILYTYGYDDNGLVVQETQTTYKEGLNGAAGDCYEIEYIYDTNGNKIKGISKEVGETETTITTYTYDCVGYVEYSTVNNAELNTTDKWEPLEGASFLPTPSSCVNTITSIENDSDSYIYTYLLDEDKVTADMYYHMYQGILSDVCGLIIEINDNGSASVYQGGDFVITMTMGHDIKSGYFFQISFVE